MENNMNAANLAVFQPEVRLKKVSFQNFRGFEQLELELQPDLTVFIGNNGAGKTAILDGMANVLRQFENMMRFEGWENEAKELEDMQNIFTSFDIRKGEDKSAVTLIVGVGTRELILGAILTAILGRFVAARLKDFTKVSHFLLKGEAYNLPLVVYYHTGDAPVNPISFQAVKDDFETGIFTAYDGALDKKSLDFLSFFSWYRWQENIEKQLGDNPVLKVVRQAIYTMLSDHETHFDKLTINWVNSPTGEMLIEKNGIALNINQLSSGEKTLLALVADLARRLAIANPQRDNPLLGYGVVLIDELDLHLHPRWQRNVIPKLRATFPNCQLIVTTHSPQVLSQVRRENVVILNNGQVLTNIPYTFGRDSNSILFELMGVKQRPEEMQARIDKCYDLIDNDKLEEAEECFKKLAEELGPNDPDIVHGISTIHFMTA
jgi:predicted ATP-binding protein involved in virulence